AADLQSDGVEREPCQAGRGGGRLAGGRRGIRGRRMRLPDAASGARSRGKLRGFADDLSRDIVRSRLKGYIGCHSFGMLVDRAALTAADIPHLAAFSQAVRLLIIHLLREENARR